MTKQFRWLLLVLVGLFACAGATEVTPTALPPTATAIPTSVPTLVPEQVGAPLHGYVNVSLTQADGDLVGKTQRAQLLNIYATW